MEDEKRNKKRKAKWKTKSEMKNENRNGGEKGGIKRRKRSKEKPSQCVQAIIRAHQAAYDAQRHRRGISKDAFLMVIRGDVMSRIPPDAAGSDEIHYDWDHSARTHCMAS